MQIAPKNENSVLLSDNFKSVSFGIKQDGLAHIFGVLRNQLYSDKILAVIREYSANALDANVEAGSNKPIVVTAPNSLDPVFKVRDYGSGLNEDEIRDIYSNYGESTKRNSNKLIGQLGLGSKSAFAYGDNFLINSFVNGKKTTYNAYIDPTQIGMIAKMYEEDTCEPNGVEISVPVKSKDISSFHSKIKEFFKYWNPIPDVRGIEGFPAENPVPVIEGSNWKYFVNNKGITSSPVIVMGNVAYPLVPNEVSQEFVEACNQKTFYAPMLSGFVFYTDIGTLEVSASREDLQYTDYTKKSIGKIFKAFNDELVSRVNDKINSASNLLEAKRVYKEFFGDLFGCYSALSFLSKECNWNGHEVDSPIVEFIFSKDECLADGKEAASINCYGSTRRSRKSVNFYLSNRLSSEKETLNVIDDCDGKNLLKRMRHTIIDKKTYKEINVIKVRDQALWDKALKTRGMENYTFTKLSELEYPININEKVSKLSSGSSQKNEKHTKKAFILNTSMTSYSPTASDYWDAAVVDIKNDSGVWIQIDRFKYEDQSLNYFNKSLSSFVSTLGITNSTPKIYGFKEVPKGLEKNANFVEVKKWVVETSFKKLENDGAINEFNCFLKLSNFELPYSYVSLMKFVKSIEHQIPDDSKDLKNLIKDYEEVSNIMKNTSFAQLKSGLVYFNCYQTFLEKLSSQEIHPFIKNMESFLERNPMLNYVNDSYFGYMRKPEFEKSILSYIK